MDRAEELRDALDEMTGLLEPTEKEIQRLAEKFKEIYSDNAFRHSYYEISQQLESLSGDVRDNICNIIDLVIQRIEHDCPSDNISKGMTKLYDHLKLETLRLARMDKVSYLCEKAEKSISEAQELNKKSQIGVDSLKRRVDGFHGQSITILGIFSGLVLGFSAEIQLLSESFANIDNMHMRNMLLYLLIIGFVVFNTLFMLMYAISKIADHSIAVLCKDRDCTTCPENHRAITRLFRKYPYILIFDFIVIIAIALVYFFIK